MKSGETVNALTGLLGFGAWVGLSLRSPEHSLQIALGVLLVLLGFGGRETIKDILKTWRGNGEQ